MLSAAGCVAGGEIRNRRIVAGLVSGPSACLGIAGFDSAKLTKELAWTRGAEDVEQTVPVGDVERLDDAGGSIGKYGSSDVGDRDRSDDGVIGGLGLRADEPSPRVCS